MLMFVIENTTHSLAHWCPFIFIGHKIGNADFE